MQQELDGDDVPPDPLFDPKTTPRLLRQCIVSSSKVPWNFVLHAPSPDDYQINELTTLKVPCPSLSTALNPDKQWAFFKTFGCETLQDVLKWNRPFDERMMLLMPSLMRPKRTKKNPGSKVLFCHDYKYNYREHRGIRDPLGDEMQFYSFPYWSLIDIFVYFSHKLLTIPPPEWIVACHTNGVPCFGTFLVEHWVKYSLAFNMPDVSGQTFLENILDDLKLIDRFIDAMLKISSIYKVDGWLMNIETPMKSTLVPRMEYFLKKLKTGMHNLYSDNDPFPIRVVWYDSVIKNGKLSWQNELNESNEIFFLNSDAIFLNYTWKENNLVQSLKNAQKFEKQFDVFVGVDCYGRGCLGGGGHQTYQAIREILAKNLSVAIFAPGWTHESQLDNGNPRTTENKRHKFEALEYHKKKYQNYTLEDEYRFWSLLAMDGGLLTCENHFTSLPLMTNFNVGKGFNYFLLGKRHSGRWFNYEQMQLMPSFIEPEQFNNDQQQRLSITFDRPFNGGTSFQIEMFSKNLLKPITLFRTNIEVNKENSWFRYQIVYKTNDSKNFRIRTFIDLVESTETKRLVLDHTGLFVKNSSNIRHRLLNYERFHVNDWLCEQRVIKLEPPSSITLTAFSIYPYFITESTVQINREMPFVVNVGEFYFDFYDSKQDHNEI